MEKYLSLLSFGDTGWGDELLQGALVTISIALATLPFGLALGLLVALASRSQSKIISGLATLYTTVFRGVPELLTLYIIYFGGQILLQKIWTGIGFSGSLSISPFIAGMVALGLVLGAFPRKCGSERSIPFRRASARVQPRLGSRAGRPSASWYCRSFSAWPCPASATTGWCC